MSDAAQRSDDWFAARRGLVTASRVKDVAKKQKNGSFYATRETYKNQLIAEILTGVSISIPVSAPMQHGIDTEDEAAKVYADLGWDEVTEAPFVVHPTISRAGASPDRYVGDKGIMEIKCPNTTTHVLTLRENDMPEDHMYQVQWQMACTGREFCDFMSYDPRLPEKYRVFLKRIPRNASMISDLEAIVKTFLEEIDAEIKSLEAKSFRDLTV